MPEESENGPDFKALLAQAPAAAAAPKEETAPGPDYHALLESIPDSSGKAGPNDIGSLPGGRRDPRIPRTSTGNPLGTLAAGTSKTVIGVVSALADQIDPKLGNKVANTGRAIDKALMGPTPSAHDKSMESAAAMVPALMAAGGGGILAGAATGAGLGLVSPQEADTPEGRNMGRLENAGTGAVFGGVGGAVGNTIGAAASKIGNSKKLDGIIKGLKAEFDSFVPTADNISAGMDITKNVNSAVFGKGVSTMRKQEQIVGGLDAQPIRAASKGDVVSPTSTSGRLLKTVQSELEQYAPKPGKDAALQKGLIDSMKPGPAKDNFIKQIELRTGKQIGFAPAPKADIFHLQSLSDKIDAHLDSLPAGEKATPDATALKTIQKTIDGEISGFMKSNPEIGKNYQNLMDRWKPLLDDMRKPEIASLMSGDQASRAASIVSTFKSGNVGAAKNVARFLGPSQQQDAYHLMLHDAYMTSLDKKTGVVDAAKFAHYFDDPAVKRTLPLIQGRDGKSYPI